GLPPDGYSQNRKSAVPDGLPPDGYSQNRKSAVPDGLTPCGWGKTSNHKSQIANSFQPATKFTNAFACCHFSNFY
ncbi:MAG TPA: hypothetical protein PLC70_10035, partial [Bacteroidales bacterium]|nr:hypothetical protein [Bacteroidales bacterium]